MRLEVDLAIDLQTDSELLQSFLIPMRFREFASSQPHFRSLYLSPSLSASIPVSFWLLSKLSRLLVDGPLSEAALDLRYQCSSGRMIPQ